MAMYHNLYLLCFYFFFFWLVSPLAIQKLTYNTLTHTELIKHTEHSKSAVPRVGPNLSVRCSRCTKQTPRTAPRRMEVSGPESTKRTRRCWQCGDACRGLDGAFVSLEIRADRRQRPFDFVHLRDCDWHSFVYDLRLRA